ncbi:MAG TPA: dienelactone hydrolase family protein [Candidatus Limnocylindrales bacterium]|nr:dienelactone hydrolase family protein [Candidatus Limnocylindrales bacterium]
MDPAIVDDIRYDGGADAPGEVEAYLVRPGEAAEPLAPDSCAAILWWHWLDSEAPDGNRSQFRDEAAELAGRGVVSLLPQGRFPWSIDPAGSVADFAQVRAEVARLRAGIDLLVARPEVDPRRIAVVGHDYGAMHGIVAAAEDQRVAAIVVIAATPRWSDWNVPFWGLSEAHFDYDRAMQELDPIERIAAVAPRPILLQFGERDWFIAQMSAWGFRRAAGGPDVAELKTYDAAHDIRHPDARPDRLAFLARVLGLPPAG